MKEIKSWSSTSSANSYKKLKVGDYALSIIGSVWSAIFGRATPGQTCVSTEVGATQKQVEGRVRKGTNQLRHTFRSLNICHISVDQGELLQRICLACPR